MVQWTVSATKRLFHHLHHAKQSMMILKFSYKRIEEANAGERLCSVYSNFSSQQQTNAHTF
jgi:hypothetical protein